MNADTGRLWILPMSTAVVLALALCSGCDDEGRLAGADISTGTESDALEPPTRPHTGEQSLFALDVDHQGAYVSQAFYELPDLGITGHAMPIERAAGGSFVLGGITVRGWDGPDGEPPINPYGGGPDIMVLALSSQLEYDWHAFYGSKKGYQNDVF